MLWTLLQFIERGISLPWSTTAVQVRDGSSGLQNVPSSISKLARSALTHCLQSLPAHDYSDIESIQYRQWDEPPSVLAGDVGSLARFSRAIQGAWWMWVGPTNVMAIMVAGKAGHCVSTSSLRSATRTIIVAEKMFVGMVHFDAIENTFSVCQPKVGHLPI